MREIRTYEIYCDFIWLDCLPLWAFGCKNSSIQESYHFRFRQVDNNRNTRHRLSPVRRFRITLVAMMDDYMKSPEDESLGDTSKSIPNSTGHHRQMKIFWFICPSRAGLLWFDGKYLLIQRTIDFSWERERERDDLGALPGKQMRQINNKLALRVWVISIIWWLQYGHNTSTELSWTTIKYHEPTWNTIKYYELCEDHYWINKETIEYLKLLNGSHWWI